MIVGIVTGQTLSVFWSTSCFISTSFSAIASPRADVLLLATYDPWGTVALEAVAIEKMVTLVKARPINTYATVFPGVLEPGLHVSSYTLASIVHVK